MVNRIYRPTYVGGGDVVVAMTTLTATPAFAQFYDGNGVAQPLHSASVQLANGIVNTSRPANGTSAGGADHDVFEFGGGNEIVIWDDLTTDAAAQAQLHAGERYGLPGLSGVDTGTLNQTRAIDEFVMGAGNDIVSLVYNAASSGIEYTAAATIYGGDGNDVVMSGAGSDSIYGGNNNDTLFGGNAADTIYGGAGVDTIQGGAGADVMLGSSTTLSPSEGDWISYSDSSAGVRLTLTFDITVEQGLGDATGDRISGFDHAIGSFFDDEINLAIGTTSNNSLVGLGGNDTMRAGDGNDTMYGGAGGNITLANAQAGGIDTLFGNGGDDVIYMDPDLTIDGAGSNDSVLVHVGDGNGATRPNNLTLALTGGYNTSRDYMEGNEGQDSIVLTTGNDVLLRNQDDLTVDGATLATNVGANLIEVVDGLGGNDVIVLNNASVGTAGTPYVTDLTLIGGDGNDFIAAGNGQDILWGDLTTGNGNGNDTLFGGSGNDTITGSDGDDFIEGGVAGDTMSGGNGQDTLSYSFSSGAVQVTIGGSAAGNHAAGDVQSGFEHLLGSGFNDALGGDGGNNRIFGGAGVDTITAFAGTDTIDAGDGGDTVYGGDANDTITGGAGVDTIEGGNGGDTMFGGGDGDWLSYASTPNPVTASLTLGTGSGNDASGDVFSGFANIIGSTGSDTLTGDNAANTIFGGTGVDTIEGRGGADSLVGGGTSDWLSYANSASAVTITLSGSGSGGEATGDTVSGFANLLGSANADSLTGDSAANTIFGGLGIDTIQGGAGGDTLAGGTAVGASGFDWLSYSASAAAVSVTINGSASGGDAAGDSLSGFANLIGSANADTLTGDTAVNIIIGGGGADTIEGRAGGDTLAGGVSVGAAGTGDWVSYANAPAAVTVNLQAGTGSAGEATGDVLSGFANIIGSNSADSLRGDDNNNTIFGGTGADTVEGGAGADSMAGGGNGDWLSYANAAGAGVTVNLLTGVGSGAGSEAAGDTFSGFQHIIGMGRGDNLIGNALANTIIGGDGSDTIEGGVGVDTLYGGNDVGTTDWLSYAGSSIGVTVNLGSAVQGGLGDATGDITTGFENLIGSGQADTLTGSTGNNVIFGNDGVDTIQGGLGDDTLSGGSAVGATGEDDWVSYSGPGGPISASLFSSLATGAGTDTLAGFSHIIGSSSGDFLEGGDGLNSLLGEGGNDTLSGLAGIDSLFGGDNDDLLLMGTNGGTFVAGTVAGWDGENNAQINAPVPLGAARVSDKAFGGNGTDTMNLSSLGGATNSVFTAPDQTIANHIAGIEIIVAGAAADVINLTFNDGVTRTAYTGNVTVYAGANADVVFSGSGADLIVGGRETPGDGTETADTLFGGSGNDIIYGDDFTTVAATGGGDSLYGGAGGDTMFGGFGGDTMYGGSGADELHGNLGNDFLYDFDSSAMNGDEGSDLIVVASTSAGSNYNVTGGKDDLAGDSADRVFAGGNYGSVTASLGADNDVFISANVDSGSAQIDRVQGESQNDVISTWFGSDTLDGGDGNDALWGGAGVDTVTGGIGGDYLYGGAGDGDLLIGGDGDDYYYFARTDGDDRIDDQDPNGIDANNYIVVIPNYDPATDQMVSGSGVFETDGDLYDNDGNDMVQLVDIGAPGGQYRLDILAGAGAGSSIEFDQADIGAIALWNNDATAGTPVITVYEWDSGTGRYELA